MIVIVVMIVVMLMRIAPEQVNCVGNRQDQQQPRRDPRQPTEAARIDVVAEFTTRQYQIQQIQAHQKHDARLQPGLNHVPLHAVVVMVVVMLVVDRIVSRVKFEVAHIRSSH